jgi:transcriptional antiterminator Rof (Rho-off)
LQQRASAFTRWTFQEDFSQGIPGWMSFPLPQDVGYDPSLYTKRVGGAPVLVRDVTAYGQRVLRVGLVRPLSFHVAPSSLFRISYELEMCGKTTDVHLALAGADGRRYGHSLSILPGAHDVQVDGRQLEIPAAGTEVEAIVIEAEVALPASGSHNRLMLHALEIHAERPERVVIRAPGLDHSSVHDIAVAQEVVATGKPLKMGLGPGAAARVAVYDDVGRLVRSANIPAGEARETQLAAPDKPGLYKVEITSQRARSRFCLLVLGEVPLHPRVLLTAQRLEQLRSQSYSNELLAIVHRRASELGSSIAYNANAGQHISLLPVVSVFPGLPEYFALMESYSNAIAFNALDFRLSGDRQALEAARHALLTVAAWPTWTPPWFAAHGLHTYYEVGVFTQRVALGYDLIAGELSPEEKAKIAQAFWENSIRPALDDYFFYDRLPIAASNHEAQSVGGALEACVALDGDVPDWETKFGPALAELVVAFERLLEGLFPGDGSEAEPAGYEDFAMQGMSWGMAALHALDIRPAGFEKMTEAFWWPRYAQVRPDLLLDTGDFGSEFKPHSGYAWGAEYAGEPALRAFYETATEQSLMGVFGVLQSGQSAQKAPGLVDLVCCTHPALETPEPPLSRLFPGRGSAVLRSGWGREDTVVSLRVGPWFNHEHHDQGSFRVAAHGEELVAEAGPADYYREPHYPDYFTQAPGHNAVVIDDDPFSQEDYDGRYWPSFQNFAKLERHLFSPGIDYLAADLAPAYADAGQVKRMSREYLFVKPDLLIIHDRIEVATPHSYSWFLHIPPGAQANLDAAQAVVRRKVAFVALSAAGENTHWTLQQQPIPISAYGNLDRTPVEPREALRLDSPRDKEGSFLVALHFQKTEEEPAALQPLATTSGQGFQAAGGAAQVLFRCKPGQLTVGGLTADGDLLAIRQGSGVEEIFGGNLKFLQRGRQVLFSSNPATDVALREAPAAVEVHVFCSAITDLRIYAEKPAREVKLDQGLAPYRTVRGLVTPPPAGGYISFERLAKGEHVVSITYYSVIP